MQHGGLVSSTTSHKIASEVLRSPSFRVGIGSSERLSPIARRMMAMATDPWCGRPGRAAVDAGGRPAAAHEVPPAGVEGVHRRGRWRRWSRASRRSPTELLDEMERQAPATVDLVDMYAGPLPVRVISEILGVPAYMQDSMLEWGNAAAVTLDPALHYRRVPQRVATRCGSIHAWLDNHLKELRRNPGDDLMSQLACSSTRARTLNDVELRSTALLVIGAGFETTVNLIGNGVDAAARASRPARGRCRPTRRGGANAVDEVLRYDSPVQVTVRVAGEDTEVCGHACRPGGSSR